MNKKQRRAIWIGLALLVLCGTMVPYEGLEYRSKNMSQLGYSFILNPPYQDSARVVVAQVLIPAGMIIFVTVILVYMLDDKRKL